MPCVFLTLAGATLAEPCLCHSLSMFLSQVNGIAFHPVHGTLATVGSDGRFSFWDKDARTKLKTSEQLDQPIAACCFNHNGNIFAYASSYDWSKVRTSEPALVPPSPALGPKAWVSIV